MVELLWEETRAIGTGNQDKESLSRLGSEKASDATTSSLPPAAGGFFKEGGCSEYNFEQV
jgi:hypothetical protein